MLGIYSNRIFDSFYREGHWVVNTFWNSLYLAFFFMPIGINLPSPFFIVSMIFGIAILVGERKGFVFEPGLLLFPLYFVLLCIGLLYTHNLDSGFNLVQRSLSLLFFPIIFMFVREDAASVKRLFQFLLAGILVSFAVNFSVATYALIVHATAEVPGNDFFLLFEWIHQQWPKFYMGSAFSKAVNPNYISIYLLLVLSYYLRDKLISRNGLVVLVLLFGYLYLLASITAYLILAVISALFISDVKDKQKKYIAAVIFFLGALVFFNNPRISGFYKSLKGFNVMHQTENVTPEKAKFLAWDTALRLIREALVLGYGTGDANDALVKKYLDLGYGYNYTNRYNAHNQFLQTYLQIGVLGFALLILIFGFLSIRLKGSRAEFSLFLILFVSLLVESMLVRFNGIAFFSVVVPLLLKKRSILGSRIIRNTEKVISLKP